MKKLIFCGLLMAALCACEAPEAKEESEKEVIVMDGVLTPTEVPEDGGADMSGEDEPEGDTETAATPAAGAQTPAKPGEPVNNPVTDEPGPTPTAAASGNGGNDTVNDNSGIKVDVTSGKYAKGKELMCACTSEKQARDIASVYGVSFVEYAYGIATFTTSEDPAAVVQRGKDNGWTPMEINYSRSIQ